MSSFQKSRILEKLPGMSEHEHGISTLSDMLIRSPIIRTPENTKSNPSRLCVLVPKIFRVREFLAGSLFFLVLICHSSKRFYLDLKNVKCYCSSFVSCNSIFGVERSHFLLLKKDLPGDPSTSRYLFLILIS